jgi:hypothetical protein
VKSKASDWPCAEPAAGTRTTTATPGNTPDSRRHDERRKRSVEGIQDPSGASAKPSIEKAVDHFPTEAAMKSITLNTTTLAGALLLALSMGACNRSENADTSTADTGTPATTDSTQPAPDAATTGDMTADSTAPADATTPATTPPATTMGNADTGADTNGTDASSMTDANGTATGTGTSATGTTDTSTTDKSSSSTDNPKPKDTSDQDYPPAKP